MSIVDRAPAGVQAGVAGCSPAAGTVLRVTPHRTGRDAGPERRALIGAPFCDQRCGPGCYGWIGDGRITARAPRPADLLARP